jgi:hypothetical protein
MMCDRFLGPSGGGLCRTTCMGEWRQRSDFLGETASEGAKAASQSAFATYLSGRGVMCVVGLAFLLCRASSNAADREREQVPGGTGGVSFTVDGVVRCQQSEPEVRSTTSEFHAVVSEDRWYISLRPLVGNDERGSSSWRPDVSSPSILPREWIASFDGTNCYYLTVLPTNRIAAGQPDATGELVLGSTPKRGNPDLVAVWYAYASGRWLKSHALSNGQELPFLGDPLFPVARSEVTLDALSPCLPALVIASNALPVDRDLRWSERRFRRSASTNVGSLSLPSRSEMTYSRSILGRNYYFVDVALRQARLGADRELFVPSSRGYVTFYTRDFRPANSQVPGVGLTLTNPTDWPTSNRLRALATAVGEPAGLLPHSRQRRNLVRLALLVALVAVPAIAVARARARRRSYPLRTGTHEHFTKHG